MADFSQENLQFLGGAMFRAAVLGASIPRTACLRWTGRFIAALGSQFVAYRMH